MSIICEAPDIIEEIYNNQKERVTQLLEAFENLFKTIAVPDLRYPLVPLDYSWFIQTILKFNEAVQFLKDKQCVGDVPFGLLSGLCSQLVSGLIQYIEQNIDSVITEFQKALFLNDVSKAFADIAGLIQTIFSIANATITDIQKLVDIYDCVYLTQKTLTLTESI
jgi:hypothetical protein